MSERAPAEVWIDAVSQKHCYIRLGKRACIATVNYPADSQEAEAVRSALEKVCGASAKGVDLNE